jgi:thiol-disulfide isomerase/thioredoxin
MITKLLISLMTMALFFTACDKKETPAPAAPQKETKTEQPKQTKANVLTLTATDGKTFKLTATENGIDFDGLEGKVVLLDFFATWCPPCRAEMPHLVNLQKRYNGKVQILSILMEEEKENSEAISFAKEYNLNFPILNSKENFLLSQALGGIRSLPTLVMYDKEGNYFTHYVGAAPEEMIESDIKKALAK